ncbi:hypothetical protein OAR76_02605 [Candidatus Pelagibacter sp.]|nr:hypothetical protein [Candidatus Pelagibacter sp.]
MTIIKQNYKTLIKNIFSAQWKYGIKTLNLAILISIFLISYYHLSKGFVMSPDSYWYSKTADNLINLNFNLYYFFEYPNINESFFYIFPIFLIALSKLSFGAEWQNAFMAFNLILVLFSLILFSKSLLLLKVRPLAISFAIILLTLSTDLLVWPRYMLTDMIFSFLIMMIIYLMIKNIVKEKFNYYHLIFFITLIFLSRPTAFPFILTIILFISILKLKINFRPKLISLSFFLLIIFIPFVLAIFYQLMSVHFNENPQAVFLIKMVDAGMIIHDRPETWVSSPNSFLEIVNLYFIRFMFFFAPYVKSFSVIHIILNSLQTFFVFFSIFVWFFLGERYKLINKTVTLILLICVSVAAFQAFTLIDYDFRYRFPIIMPLIIIFPISIELLIKKIEERLLNFKI